MNIDTKVNVSGPIFDEAETAGVIQDFQHDVLEEAGDDAERLLKQRMGSSFKNPTGRFERNTEVLVRDEDLLIKNDMVYGPWLEGTSSRNDRSRFKGYQIFRKTAQEMENRVEQIAERRLPEYLEKLQ